MAPLRSSRSSRSQTFADNNPTTTNRTRTGQIDHDVFEGLPVRRWARQPFSFSQTPKDSGPDGNSGSMKDPHDLPELPMPKDSNLLTPMSREMLRAARAGCRYIRPTPKYVDDEDKDAGDADDAAEVVSAERSFTARKWSAVPRNVEPPEVEYLAKRRPGLPSLYGATTVKADTSDAAAANPMPPLRKTKIKKVDATSGIATIYEVWVPEGHALEGEVHESGGAGTETSEGIMILPTPAPGTVVEGVGVVNPHGNLVVGVDGTAPLKRRPPPPKRKGKGFGNRGRRKKVMFAHGEGAEKTPAGGAVEGNPPAAGDAKPSPAVPGGDLGASRMSVDSAAATPDNRPAGEEEDENEEDEESDEGEEGEEADESGELAEDTKSPGTAVTNAPPGISGPEEANSKPQQEAGHVISEQTPSRDLSSSPDLPLATTSANRKLSMDKSPVKETHPQQQQQHHQSPDLPAETANPPPSTSPPVPEPAAADTDLPPEPKTQPEPERKKPDNNQNPPDKMEGVVHHPKPPATGLSSLPPKPPAPEQSSKPESTTPADQEPDSKEPSNAPEPSPLSHFEDGEVDLLGSLEASLEKEGGGEKGEEGKSADVVMGEAQEEGSNGELES